MIRAMHFAPTDEAAVISWPPSEVDGGWIWLDVSGESVASLADLTAEFGFDTLALEDAMRDQHIPMFDDYVSYLFVVLHGLDADDRQLSTAEVDAFVGENFLVTVHGGSATVQGLYDHLTGGSVPVPHGPDELLAAIADVQSRRLLGLAESLDDAVLSVEERAIMGDPSVLEDIQSLRRDAALVRRATLPLRDVLGALASTASPLLGERARRRFDSAYDHVNRLVETVEASRAVLVASHDTYRSTVAERTNDAMRVLTVYSVILLPLTLIAGIYGMNFSNMPELEWRTGYFWLIGLMAALAIGQWIYFFRRGFIGRPSSRLLGRPASLLVQVAKLPFQPAVALFEHARGRNQS